jgi:hypothetical protein
LTRFLHTHTTLSHTPSRTQDSDENDGPKIDGSGEVIYPASASDRVFTLEGMVNLL